MPHLDVDGERIHYEVDGQGPPVLLLHSLGGGLWVWDDFVRRARAQFTSIRYDAPGHGSSSYTRPFSIDRSARIGHALLAHLKAGEGGRCAVVGVSLGGHTALRMYAQDPRAIGALVLAGHTQGGVVDSRAFVQKLEARMQSSSPEDFAQSYVQSRTSPGARAADMERYAQSVLSMAPRAFFETLDAILRENHAGWLDRIDVPALVVGGSADASAPIESIRHFSAMIAGARFHEIEGGGHFAYLDHSEEFSSHVLGFLAESLGHP